MFQTLQSRLPIELKLEGIDNTKDANKFLTHYLKEFNKQFALETYHIKSVYENQPTSEEINLYLSIITKRKLDSGHTFKFKSQYMLPTDKNSQAHHFNKGTEVLVIEAFNGKTYCNIDNVIYAAKKIESHERFSREFDTPVVKSVKTKYIPTDFTPWKRELINEFIKSSGNTYTFDEICYSQASIYGY